MSGEEEVKLLSFWGSMFGMRVQIALAEKGIPYVYQEEDLRSKSNLLLQMNPVHKQIPVLIHDGKPVCESLVIVQYIDEVWNHVNPLLPVDPYEKALAKFSADLVDLKIHWHARKIWLTKGKEQEDGKKDFLEGLKFLESQLGEKSYFGGQTFGYADIALITYYSWFYVYETFGNFSVEQECPKLFLWAKRCIKNKESVSQSLVEQKRIFEFVLRVRKRVGLDP